MKKQIDVLLVARPDHSMQIYNSILKQDRLKFIFLSFKIFPEWLKRLTKMKKMTTVSKNAICSWRLTFIDLCRYKFKFKFAQNWDETHIFDVNLKRIFRKQDVKLIHYWPEYGDTEILKYATRHPGVLAIADIHMPHPVAVYETMKPIYDQYGIDPKTTQLYVMSQKQHRLAERASDILVPSSYVADTYREVYTNKKYHIISYGISISTSYEKRVRSVIKEFVYAGRISLEKGSDLLLYFFSTHPDLNIHLYGGVIKGQEAIFDKYRTYDNIIFHGSVPKIELQEHLKRYDVGIHLSRFDAYSLAVGEMIGSGLPVIVSSNTGNKDDILELGVGEVTELDVFNIELSIASICDVSNYNRYSDNIDKFINSHPLDYGHKMLSFYNDKINEL